MPSSPQNTGEGQPQELPKPEDLCGIIPGFEVTAFLAQGGMGAIYRGEQTKLERPVAIKILPRSYGEEYNYADRFEIEAKAMAKLSHNNIVSVYDYGETTGGHYLYFVMEYIEGSNLFQLLQKGPLEIDQAIKVLRQVCAGLQYAHEHGIIHRDIKPSNILVDQRGVVKMADFGLAKVIRDRGAHPGEMEDDEGMVMGTPDYIAPEALIEGVEIDYRADIFSVGVLTYELLTGKLPRGSFAVPSKARPGVDRRFDDIVRTAMLEDRGTRYQQISEIDRILADVGKAPKMITGKGKGKRKGGRKTGTRGAPRMPRPPAAKKKKLPLPAAGASPSPKPVAKGAASVGKSSSQKRKIPIPQSQSASPVQTRTRVPTRVRTGAGTRAGIRTRGRAGQRPVPPGKSTSAMVAIGVAFLVIVLIGAAMMWFKSRQAGEEKDPGNSPRSAPPEKKEEEEGGFFGVPLSVFPDRIGQPGRSPCNPTPLRGNCRAIASAAGVEQSLTAVAGGAPAGRP